MEKWLRWLWQWTKYLHDEYKPKPRTKPIKPAKPSPRMPREYAVPQKYTLQILELYDAFRNKKGSDAVEKHRLWLKIQEAIPHIPSGRYNIDVSTANQVVIREATEKDD